MEPKKQLVLIDGSSYLYRAFHALPPLMTSDGKPTGAVHGVLNMIKRTLADYPAHLVAVIFDAKGKTFRDELFKEYKANRPPMPDDLRLQIKPIHEIIKAQGLPLISHEGVEADDIIGTLAMQARAQGMNVVISTGDKDIAQIVNSEITLVNTMSNSLLDEAGVVKKFGIRPDQIIDYLSLVGDSVDNVPGIPRVGPKTAVKWLHEYETIDNLIKHADEIKGKVGENLRNNLDQLELSRKLVTLHCDLDLDIDLEVLVPTKQNDKKLIELYKEYELRSLLNNLLNKQPAKTKTSYEAVLTKEQFNSWLEKLKSVEEFAFDTETTALNAMSAELVGLSVAVEPNTAAYIPLAHDYENAPEQLSREWVLEQLKPILEDSTKKVIGHNLKYDIIILSHYGINLKPGFDTMLESYILNSGMNRHNLDDTSLKYLGKTTIKFEDIAGKGKKMKTFNQIEIEEATPYAAEDADVSLQLHKYLWPKICEIPELKSSFETFELPLVSVLASMEQLGVKIDSDMLKKQSIELESRLNILQDNAYKIAGKTFNLSSPKQLQEILFTDLRIPVIKKTPKGQPSTSEPVLQELANDYPLPAIILEYRSLSKLKSTYTDKLPQQINPNTGRVHTSYNQAVTVTGRLSSSDPNLQNIPIRTEEGKKIREAFIAKDGYKLLAADYSQIELRIMAHISGDENLNKAFSNNHDVHTATASEVFGLPADQVTPLQRRNAKAINFGLLYGMSAFGLSQQLKIPQAEAKQYIELYFQRYPKVKEYMENTRVFAEKHGYVETIFGRRLYLPEINSNNHMQKMGAQRAAINAPMQGSSADIIKIAMIKVGKWLETHEIDGQMIMQVHDELVFEIKNSDIDKAKSEIPRLMSEAAKLNVPLIANVDVGSNWAAAH